MEKIAVAGPANSIAKFYSAPIYRLWYFEFFQN